MELELIAAKVRLYSIAVGPVDLLSFSLSGPISWNAVNLGQRNWGMHQELEDAHSQDESETVIVVTLFPLDCGKGTAQQKGGALGATDDVT